MMLGNHCACVYQFVNNFYQFSYKPHLHSVSFRLKTLKSEDVMRIFRYTQRSYFVVLTVGFLLLSVYVLEMRNPLEGTYRTADELDTTRVAGGVDQAVRMTVRKDASSGPDKAPYITTNEIGKASAGNGERTADNSLNVVRLQKAVPTTSTEAIDRPLCKYPDLQMESSEFSHLFEKITNLNCGHAPINYLTYLDGSSRTDKSPWDVVKLNSSALLPTQKLLNCTYSTISRRFGDFNISYTTLHTKVFASNEEIIQFSFKDEFSKITCFLEEDTFNQTLQDWVKIIREHNNMFVQVIRNDSFVKDKKAEIEKKGRMKKALGHGMNVLMVGVDSTSRVNFMRKLPKTFQYFTETLEGHVLKGYHVIGDGTTAQFIAMLSGFFEEELPNAKTGTKNATKCDVFPLVWNKFRRMGYTTMYEEDEPQTGAFQYRLKGFKRQPTDYYMRPFWVAQKDLKFKERFCFGATPKHHYTLKYAHDFVEAYHDVPKFAIVFHTELSHGSLNRVQVADEDILTLIKSWKDKGYLNNTVLILFSDHGARYGRLRQLLQGRLEERLSFFGIAVPPWMKESHPEIIRNLKINEERLTTAFDFHKTLRHVLDYRSDPSGFQGRGLSLFQEIPLNRTCEDASIADHWCTCLLSVPVNKKNKLLRQAAGFAVSHMNRLTAKHRKLCTKLFLKNITHAEVIKPNRNLLLFGGSDPLSREALFDNGKNLTVPFLDFRITLETGPNGGAYEVSVRKWLSDEKTEITADISRINAYGNHASCIQDKFPHLRKFCFCREFLKPVSPE
ncbi:uncharacterized protein LOC144863206 [Branchiostoma floridae x Branchiostoma japonicum]